jgi:hypothetical protein
VFATLLGPYPGDPASWGFVGEVVAELEAAALEPILASAGASAELAGTLDPRAADKRSAAIGRYERLARRSR